MYFTHKQLEALAKYPHARGEYNRRMLAMALRNTEREAERLAKGSTVRFRAAGDTEWTEIPYGALKALAK